MAAYLEFFQLSQHPFTGTAHRRSAVATPPIRQTAEQVGRLLRDEWPVLCVTGAPGIGKTHLALAIGSLIGDGIQWVRVESGLAWNDVSAAACTTLGLSDGGLNAAELGAIRGRGKRVVFLIDHAEQLSDECLANLEALVLQKLPSDEQIVQCVLFARKPGGNHNGRGLHAWLEHLGAPEIDFDPLPRDAVSIYIERHLSWAGHDGSELFTHDATEFLHAITGGIPEVLSRQCERLLEEAAAEGLHRIDRTFAARVFGRGDLTETPSDHEPVANPRSGSDLRPETGDGSGDRATGSADDDDLLRELADGFLERLDAWEPGQLEANAAAEPSVASPVPPAPVETTEVPEAAAVSEPGRSVPPPAPRGRRIGLVAAAAVIVIAAAGFGLWQSGTFGGEATVATDTSETRLDEAGPPASIAFDAGTPELESAVAFRAESVLQPLASPAADEFGTDTTGEPNDEPDATLLAEASETIPQSAEIDVAPEPEAAGVTAITVDVRMRRRNPVAIERTASDYEADF